MPPNPAEILGSKKLKEVISKLSESFDMILIDTPPVGQLTDAAILGGLVDGVILVIASGQSSIEMAKHAKAALDNVDAKILGVVLTKLDKGSGGGYYYRYYNYDRYYYDE